MPLIGRPSINKQQPAKPPVEAASETPAGPFGPPSEAAEERPQPALPLDSVPGARYLQSGTSPAPRAAVPADPDGGAEATLELRQRLHRTLIREIDQSSLNEMGSVEARTLVEQAVRQIVDREVPASRAGLRDRLLQELTDDVLGFGPLEPLLRDPGISEIMVNGASQVYVERNGRLSLTSTRFQDDDHLVHVIERILAPTGRTIDESNPLVDARLPDGSRVNAVIPPASISGPLLTVRKFVMDRLTSDELVNFGSISQEAMDVLASAVRGGLNIIVSGGTGSGKTTMLNILSSFIPADERIVTIEDPAELSLRQPHVVRLEARAVDRHGHGLHQRDLLINALRMRPDRIIIGETRGAEAFDMMQAMNTGHDGSLSTIHANSPRDALRRIENMVLMAGFDLPVLAIREQIASAIDIVVQVERLRDGSRRVVAISEVVGIEAQTLTMQDLFQFEQEGEEDGRILGRLQATRLRPRFADRLEAHGILLPPLRSAEVVGAI